MSRRIVGLRLLHLDHPGLDEHGRHPDRPVPAHRQAARHLDVEHAPVGVGARRRLEDRARHRAVAARLLHEQQPQVVALGLEAQLALEHGVAGQRGHSAGDHAGRHSLGVGVDRAEVARGLHAVTRSPSASTASRRSSCCSAPSGSRGGRVRPPVRPDRVHRALEVLDEPGRHVEPAERQQPLVDLARLGQPALVHGVEQLHALRRHDVRDARHPARRARGESLERPVVPAHEHLEVGGAEQRGDAARVARALLHAPRRPGPPRRSRRSAPA